MQLLRFNRLMWIFGILLLVGTVAGAGWMLNHSNAQGEPQKKSPFTAPWEGEGITAVGFVDVEPGISRLYPQRPGTVVWVASEGSKLKKDEVILRIDDRLAKEKLAQAKIGLEQARKQLAEAKIDLERAKILHEEALIYPKQIASKIKQQKALVDAAEKEQNTALDKFNKVKTFYQQKKISLDAKTKAEDLYKQVAAFVDVEKEKLNEIKLINPQLKVQQAKLNIDYKKTQVDEAILDTQYKQKIIDEINQVIQQHQIVAPADGMLLRVHARVGEVLGSNPKLPAVEFCPEMARIIRTEVQQEWAATVKVGQQCIIKDDTASGQQWRGKIVRISDWFTHRRSIIQEPFQFNDVRTLECIVAVQPIAGRPLRIGQRMRVDINQGGP